MFELKDLFDSREVVGCKLEQIIQNRGDTKRNVCASTGISRPTLDKILDGEVTNKTNFEKHMVKLLSYLALSPDELMSRMKNPFADMRHLRRALGMDLSHLSEIIDVSVDELKRIEAGEDVPMEELRDIAVCLGTSVMSVVGKGYFQTQVTTLDDLVKDDTGAFHSPGGFWGHLGILLCGQQKYRWFPITNYTRQLIDQNRAEKYMAIPCMDNSLLLINAKKIEELILLDEACDQPADMDWDQNVSCGEVPNVVYEAFGDYMEYKNCRKRQADPTEYGLSFKFVKLLDHFIAENKIDAEKFDKELNTATVLFASGRVQRHQLIAECSDELVMAVRQIYESGEIFGDELVTVETVGGEKVLLNFENIAMIKLPLAEMESGIYAMLEESMRERELE